MCVFPPISAKWPAIHAILNESTGSPATLTVGQTIKSVIDKINAYPEMEVEYYQIVNPLTMQPIENWSEGSRWHRGGMHYGISRRCAAYR